MARSSVPCRCTLALSVHTASGIQPRIPFRHRGRTIRAYLFRSDSERKTRWHEDNNDGITRVECLLWRCSRWASLEGVREGEIGFESFQLLLENALFADWYWDRWSGCHIPFRGTARKPSNKAIFEFWEKRAREGQPARTSPHHRAPLMQLHCTVNSKAWQIYVTHEHLQRCDTTINPNGSRRYSFLLPFWGVLFSFGRKRARPQVLTELAERVQGALRKLPKVF